MNEKKWNVSTNPHVRSAVRTDKIMELVLLALLPASIFGVWPSAGLKPAFFSALVAGCSWRYFCNPYCKAALWRPGTELYEPGIGSQMLSVNFLCRQNDQFCL